MAKEETQQAQDKATGKRWRSAAGDPQGGDPYAGIALGYGDDPDAATSGDEEEAHAGSGHQEGASLILSVIRNAGMWPVLLCFA